MVAAARGDVRQDGVSMPAIFRHFECSEVDHDQFSLALGGRPGRPVVSKGIHKKEGEENNARETKLTQPLVFSHS